MNPYEPEADWFTRDLEIHPLSSAPEPKRRFIPSKWEEKKCATTGSACFWLEDVLKSVEILLSQVGFQWQSIQGRRGYKDNSCS